MTELTKQTKIAVLCGGLSNEREVSLRSGKNCLAALHRLGYSNAVLIDMDRQIARTLGDEQIELVFLALHGRYGEDGCIQGLLEILDISYTGNRVMPSALTMDKAMTKQVLQANNLPIIPSISYSTNRDSVSSPLAGEGRVGGLSAEVDNLRFPVMVKPNAEGSSIGMTKVNSPEDLPAALEIAAKCCSQILIEEFIEGKSITVGVFQRLGKPVVTPILEFRTQTEWYDLDAKYTPGLTEFILPADLREDVTQAIQKTTLKAHHVAGCRGVSRTDFVVTPDNQFYILEINSIPGMTDLSDLPAQAQAMGVSYDELVECILLTAVDARVPV